MGFKLFNRDKDKDDDFLPVNRPGRQRDISELRIADTSIRPAQLDDIIGQRDVKRTLNVYIKSAQRRNTSLDHILLYGPPGLGKTTIASVVANETNGLLINRTGPRMDENEMINIVSQIISTNKQYDEYGNKVRVVLFIDEIHALHKDVQTILLPLVEDFTFEDMQVPEFTLVGATTDPSKIVGPLRDRFGITYSLGFYNDEDMFEILKRSLGIYLEAADWKIEELLAPKDSTEAITLDDDGWPYHITYTNPSDTELALRSISKRALGVPRIANHLLRRVLDFAYAELDELEAANPEDGVYNYPMLRPSLVAEAMRTLGIDKDGLNSSARKVLQVMFERYNDRPVGVRALASAVGESFTNIEEVIEPSLVRLGYINRESRGRALTPMGKAKGALESEGLTRWV